MTDEPQTWHYGLMARWWADRDGGPDVAFYKDCIRKFGEPALDVGCGTGRVLLPLLRAGLDVDGCDISPDMLAIARERVKNEGLETRLYNQAMHTLDLPRRYRTIMLPDSFGLGGSRANDQQTIERIYAHLEPGGVFVFNKDMPYSNDYEWPYWLPERQSELPLDWPEDSNQKTLEDGSELHLKARLFSLDPVEQTYELEMRMTQVHDGRILAEEQRLLRGNIYFKNELLLMLEKAGFSEITVTGDYTDEAPRPTHRDLVFMAKKAGS